MVETVLFKNIEYYPILSNGIEYKSLDGQYLSYSWISIENQQDVFPQPRILVSTEPKWIDINEGVALIKKCAEAVAQIGLVKSIFDNVNFNIEKGQKTVFLSHNPKAMTALFEIINGNREADGGTFKWGVTITTAYLPLDNTDFFKSEMNLVDWLGQYGAGNEVVMKGYLGRMLFSGEEVLKKVNVLSGREKTTCMIARMQLKKAN